jgi:hypothetical protein
MSFVTNYELGMKLQAVDRSGSDRVLGESG